MSAVYVDSIKDKSDTKTLATLSNSAVTLHTDVTVPASVGSSMVFLEKFTASNTTEKIFNLDSFTIYNTYVLKLNALIPVSDSNLLIELGTSSSSFHTSSSDYQWASTHTYWNGTSGGTSVTNGGTSFIEYDNQGNNAGFGVSGTINLFNPTNSSIKTSLKAEVVSFNINEYTQSRNSSSYRMASTDDAYVKFKYSSGNIASGTITLYGIKDA